MKLYQKIPIVECNEPLVPIPLDILRVESPHPYQKLGADYGDKSPYYLREKVIDALIVAQTQLQKRKPNWRLQIFDAYRPISVQQFMVDYTFNSCLQNQGLTRENLSTAIVDDIYTQVYQIWAVPSLDSTTPPPHSTGGAVDLTLVDADGNIVDMGSMIDELSPRSHPDYYGNNNDLLSLEYNHHRQLLLEIMSYANFRRHPGEWWHFCLGDQMWAWLEHQPYAYYGRVEDNLIL